jgi:hypothetical protein
MAFLNEPGEFVILTFIIVEASRDHRFFMSGSSGCNGSRGGLPLPSRRFFEFDSGAHAPVSARRRKFGSPLTRGGHA